MGEEKANGKSKNSQLVIKIVVPAIIIGIVVMIGVMKNKTDVPIAEDNPAAAATVQEGVQNSSVATESSNPDFDLAATEIDLEQLKSYGLPIMIDFGADECIPCKEMAPVLKSLNEEWRGKVIVKFVDVWKYPELEENFPVNVIPTQFFFDAKGNPYYPGESMDITFNMYALEDTEEHIYTSHEGGITEEQVRAIFAEMGVTE